MKVVDKEKPILIVGAGLGGLTLALALIRAGNQVRIFEQAPELAEVGAGLSLAPNCSKVFAQLGVIDDLAESASVPVIGEVRNGANGELLSTTPFVELKKFFNFPYYQIHRADAHTLLLNAVLAVAPDCLHLDHVCNGYTNSNEGVTLSFTNNNSASGRCAIACDGVKSSLREQMVGAQPARFTGFVAWRAIVPSHLLPEHYSQEQSNVRALHQRQVVYYPIKNGKEVNIAIFAEQDWQEEGWMIKADKQELLSLFADYDQHTLTLLDAIDSETCFKWALFDRPPLDNWQDENVVLLGDAAHPMLPFLGQGAAMAIEDAWFLAQALEYGSSPQAAFSNYQNARHERTSWVLEESRNTGKRMGSENASEETFAGDKAMFTEILFGYDPIAEAEAAFSGSA